MIESAEKATKIALEFIKKHYWFAQPLKARKEDTTWVVEVDAGVLFSEVFLIKIDASTEAIIDYEKK